MEKRKLPNFQNEKELWKSGFNFVAGVDEVGKGSFAGPIVTGCVVFSSYGGVTRARWSSKLMIQKTGPAGSSSRSMSSTIAAGTQRDSLRFHHPFFVPEGVVINDSKQMNPREREKSAVWIKKNALAWGIGEVSAQKINRLGMAKATKMSFRKAISETRKKLDYPIDFLLADAFFVSYVPGLPVNRRKNKKGRYYKNSKADAKKVNGRQKAIIKGDQKSISIAAASIIAKVYRDKLMQNLSHRPSYRKYGWGKNKGYGTSEHRTAIKKYGTTRQHRIQWVRTWQSKLS